MIIASPGDHNTFNSTPIVCTVPASPLLFYNFFAFSLHVYAQITAA
jgi:hypothetical protein